MEVYRPSCQCLHSIMILLTHMPPLCAIYSTSLTIWQQMMIVIECHYNSKKMMLCNAMRTMAYWTRRQAHIVHKLLRDHESTTISIPTFLALHGVQVLPDNHLAFNLKGLIWEKYDNMIKSIIWFIAISPVEDVTDKLAWQLISYTELSTTGYLHLQIYLHSVQNDINNDKQTHIYYWRYKNRRNVTGMCSWILSAPSTSPSWSKGLKKLELSSSYF